VNIVCRHRRVPRRLSDWRDYGRRTVDRWQRAAATLGLHGDANAAVGLDGKQVTEIELIRNGSSGHHADRVVVRVSGAAHHHPPAVDRIVAHAAQACAMELHIDRIAVRKIGKTAVFLSDSNGRRFVMRIARSPIALSRGVRNFEALQSLHDSALPACVTERVPTPIVRGTYAGYPYFVETCLEGRAGPGQPNGTNEPAWQMDAVRYISDLHARTAHRIEMDAEATAALVRDPIARLVNACGEPAVTKVMQRVEAVCTGSLGGRALPLVLAHGDFTESNCLFDERGSLSGVIDWEVSSRDGLPLLDLLQLMPIPGEGRSQERWLRFDAWMELVRNPGRPVSDPVFADYLHRLDVPAEAVPGLVLMQWVTHVADRVDARRSDDRWVRLRLRQPLETLGRTL
jgi:hypothetical protein